MKQLDNDPEYRASVAKADAERRAVQEALSRAERPLVDELQAAGIALRSAWDLFEFPESGEVVYPILVEHLHRDYPERVLDGIARAFTKKVARRHWPELLEIYLSEVRGGATRIYFLRTVNRIGNRIGAGAGREVIQRFANHPALGLESKRIIRGLGPND